MIVFSFNRRLKALIYVPLISSQLYKVSLMLKGFQFTQDDTFYSVHSERSSNDKFSSVRSENFLKSFGSEIYSKDDFSSVCSENFGMDESYLSYGQNE